MEGTAGSVRKVVPRAENEDSAAAEAAAYGESYLATTYPLQSDPKGAPLAPGLCWCPGVTLGGRVITRYPPGIGFSAPERLGKSLRLSSSLPFPFPNFALSLGMQVLPLLTNPPPVTHRLQWIPRLPAGKRKSISTGGPRSLVARVEIA